MLREYQKDTIRQRIFEKQARYFEKEVNEFSQTNGIPTEKLKRCSQCNKILLIGVDEKDCKCQNAWVPYGLLKMHSTKHCLFCGCRFIEGDSPHPACEDYCDLSSRACFNHSIDAVFPDVEPCDFSGFRLRESYHRRERCKVKCKCCKQFVLTSKLGKHCYRSSYKPDPWICRSKKFDCWWKCKKELPIQRLLEHESSCSNTMLSCNECGNNYPRRELIGKTTGKIQRCDLCTCNDPFEVQGKPLPETGELSTKLAGSLVKKALENYSKKETLSRFSRDPYRK